MSPLFLTRRAGRLSTSLACLLALAACEARETPSAQRPPQGPAAAVPVTAASVVTKNVPLELNVIGTADAYSNVAIRAQMTGELTSVKFREGDEVRKGQVLFTLDRRPLESALAQARANLDRDAAQAENARAQAQRIQDLATRGIATREQLDQSKTNVAALDATVSADRAAVENATVQLQYSTITAPLAGRTGQLMVNEGNLVRANDTAPLVVINQISPIYVIFAVPESQLAALKKFMASGSLKVEALPPNDEGPPALGRISFIDNAVDQTTGTIKVKGTFPNQDRRLWPGQYVNVTVTLSNNPNSVVMPTLAVQASQQGQFVYVVKADQTVELRPVVVQRTSGAESVIESGVKPGETVVTDGHLRLVAGSRISIKTGAGPKAAS